MTAHDRKPRVFFVTNGTRFDSSPAAEWGTVVFLFKEEPSPFATDEIFPKIAQRLLEEKWDANFDFIAMTGPLPLVVYAFCVAMDLCDEPVAALIYDARTRRYRRRDIEGLPEMKTTQQEKQG